MDWKEYEALTASIYETLGRASGVRVLCFGRECQVTGQSGARHQIDVLTSHSDGVHKYRTAIECKYWNKKVDKAAIANHILKIRDTGIEKGVVVSKLGFTRDAQQIAKQNNIGLVELRQPLDSDWDGYIRSIHVKLHFCYPETYDYRFTLPRSYESTESIPPVRGVLNIDVKFVYPDGSSESLLDLTNRKTLTEQHWDRDEEKGFVVAFDEGTSFYTKAGGAKAEIREIRFKARMHNISEEINVNAEDHVALLMKSIFEKESYTISHDGGIVSRS